jgi:hypothetical protein
MAAFQKFAAADGGAPHTGHTIELPGALSIPYAFPKKGAYRMWVQVKRAGVVRTAAFDVSVS